MLKALMYTDLRERTYVMMNDEKVVIRRRGRCKANFASFPSPLCLTFCICRF